MCVCVCVCVLLAREGSNGYGPEKPYSCHGRTHAGFFYQPGVRSATASVCAEHWGRVGWEQDLSMLDLTPGFLFGALNIGLAAAGPVPTALSATPIPSNL